MSDGSGGAPHEKDSGVEGLRPAPGATAGLRRCLADSCEAILSRYNDDDFCVLHGEPEPVARVQRRHDPRLVEAREFVATIAEAYGYTYAELTAPNRRAELVRIRARLAQFLRDEGYALEAIGGLLRRHHATVIHMLKMPVLR